MPISYAIPIALLLQVIRRQVTRWKYINTFIHIGTHHTYTYWIYTILARHSFSSLLHKNRTCTLIEPVTSLKSLLNHRCIFLCSTKSKSCHIININYIIRFPYKLLSDTSYMINGKIMFDFSTCAAAGFPINFHQFIFVFY